MVIFAIQLRTFRLVRVSGLLSETWGGSSTGLLFFFIQIRPFWRACVSGSLSGCCSSLFESSCNFSKFSLLFGIQLCPKSVRVSGSLSDVWKGTPSLARHQSSAAASPPRCFSFGAMPVL